MISMVKCNIVWKIVSLNEAFWKWMGGGFGKTITGRKDTHIQDMCLFHSYFFLDEESCPMKSAFPQWLVDIPWEWWHIVDSVLVLVAGILLSSGITSISATMATFIMSLLGKGKDDWGKKLINIHNTSQLAQRIRLLRFTSAEGALR